MGNWAWRYENENEAVIPLAWCEAARQGKGSNDMEEPVSRRKVLAFEQQPTEGDRAFAAFSLYLSLGPERSLAKVSRELGKSLTLVGRWSSKYDWPVRVTAHVAHLATVEREASEALARGKSAEWLKRQQELREREWEMHEKCIAAGKRALAKFMEREDANCSLADIARILETASKLGRMASGLAVVHVEHTGEEGGPIRIELTAALNKIYGEPGTGEVVEVEAAPGVPAQLPRKTA